MTPKEFKKIRYSLGYKGDEHKVRKQFGGSIGLSGTSIVNYETSRRAIKPYLGKLMAVIKSLNKDDIKLLRELKTTNYQFKRIRVQFGYTREEFGKVLGISPSMVRYYDEDFVIPTPLSMLLQWAITASPEQSKKIGMRKY